MTVEEKIKVLVEHRGQVVSIQQEMLSVAENANNEVAKMEAFLEAIDSLLSELRSGFLPGLQPVTDEDAAE